MRRMCVYGLLNLLVLASSVSTVEAQSPVVLIADTFTGPNGTALTSHAPDVNLTGSPWIFYGGLPAPTLLNGQVGITAGPGHVQAVLDSGVGDMEMAVDYHVGSGPGMGILAFRLTDTNNFLALLTYQNSLQLYERRAGTWTLLGSMAVAALVPGSTHRLEVQAAGSALEGWWDGVLTVQATDTFNQTATRHGLGWNSAYDASTTYGNFEVRGNASGTVTQVTITPSPVTLAATGTQTVTAQVTAQGFGSTGTLVSSGPYTWTSANPGIATAAPTGSLTAQLSAVAAGTTMVTATAPNGVRATAVVTVLSTDILVADTFTGAQMTLLTAHVPDVNLTASGWLVTGSTPPPTLGVGVVQIGPGGGHVQATVASGIADIDMSANLQLGPNRMAGLAFRLTDADNYLLLVVSNNAMQFYRKQAGVYVLLGQNALPLIGAGTTHRIEVKTTGSALEGWWDGVLVMQTADTFQQTATRHGLDWNSAVDPAATFGYFTLRNPFGGAVTTPVVTLPVVVPPVVVTPVVVTPVVVPVVPAVVALSAPIPLPAGLSTRLLQQSDIVFQPGCTFRLPIVAATAADPNGFGFATTGFAYNPAHNSLFLNGHVYAQHTAEISIPPCAGAGAPAPRATLLQPLTDITEGHLTDFGAGGTPVTTTTAKMGGLFVYNNQLIGDVYGDYDGSEPTAGQLSHFTSGLNLSTEGDFKGIYQVGVLNQGYVAGYMAAVSPEFVPLVGAPVLTGQCCLNIISRTSSGPSVTAFDPAGLTGPPATLVPATPLIYYPPDHETLGAWANETLSNPVYNQSTVVAGAVMPVGTRALLFFGKTEMGIPCYGTGTSDPSLNRQPVPNFPPQIYCYDPNAQTTGMHCSQCSLFAWAYDVADIIDVENGSKQPWDVQPYATWAFTLPPGANYLDLQGVAYDATRGLIYMSLTLADATLPGGSNYTPSPVVYTWQITGVLAQLTTPAPSSTLTASTVNFQWTGVTGASDYFLQVGDGPAGSNILNQDEGTNLSVTVTIKDRFDGTAPAPGSTVYVRLWSVINGAWASNDYTYTAPTLANAKAQMTSPAPSSALAATTVPFQWTGGTGVSDYFLQVGSGPGGSNILNQDEGTNLGVTVAVQDRFDGTLPGPGTTVYLRLWSVIAGTWVYNDYTYTASALTTAKAQMTTPAPSSKLAATTVQFQWTGGAGVSDYFLQLGSGPGGSNILNQDEGTNLSVTVPIQDRFDGTAPGHGSTVYVRLWSVIGGTWVYNDYTYTAS